MLRTNLNLALVLFFGWLTADSITSILGNPLEGIYYPLASGRLKSLAADWTAKTWFAAPVYLLAFAGIWILFAAVRAGDDGKRPAALVTAFAMAPFWIVSSITAGQYGLEINGYWLASMIYANISFFLFAFVGGGRREDLSF